MAASQNIRARLTRARLSYDGRATWALDGVSLEVRAGERLCVLGANGSGKSTLAQLLAGLEAPDEGIVELCGRVAFDGTRVDADAYREARHHTGLVFQNPEDQIVTSVVADDVAFGPENLGVDPADMRRRVEDELARVALASYAQADPARLSGGQQQRVAIAGALAMHPDMLVLDEPGAMLDVRGRRGIMRVLDRLQAAGATLVHVTHFMDEALAADRVIVMRAGKIVLEDTPREVFSHADELADAGLELPLVAEVAHQLGAGGTPCAPCASCTLSARELAAQTAPATHASAAGDAPAPNKSQTEKSLDEKGTNEKGKDGSSAPALLMQNVSFAYDGAPVLDGLSLAVAPGELVALAGHTGSGKSTLARLACALAAPTAGTVEVFGVDTQDRRRRRELRGLVGYVMQRPERQLFAETVYDDVAYGPRNLGLSKAEVDERVASQLELLGIAGKAGSSPFELSGGQQRLVALAGVLAMEPRLLVLDEPMSALDPRGASLLRDIVRTLHEAGRAIVLITHSMDDAAELADRVVTLDRGRVALCGTPREVFAHEAELHDLGLGLPDALVLAHQLEDEWGIARATLGEPLTRTALERSLRIRGGEAPC